jgi:drug/metabolite transporter (DMT)-like permease
MTVVLTLLALLAFASNSLLTRFALGAHEIDAATFVFVRLAAGALVLMAIARAQGGSWRFLRGQGWLGPVALFAYAAPFSFSYLRIGAAAGALVLFGVVQLTMIAYGVFRGERPSALTWVGIVLASGGLTILTLPSATRPDPAGVALMVVAGVAWGAYSLAGRASGAPIAANARSFCLAALPAALLLLASGASANTTTKGLVLALASGGVMSGLGYAIWYRVLPRLAATEAAVAQLTVPIIAAVGAAALLHEAISARLVVAGLFVLGGVGLVVAARERPRAQ